jgi:hypothetical protein
LSFFICHLLLIISTSFLELFFFALLFFSLQEAGLVIILSVLISGISLWNLNSWVDSDDKILLIKLVDGLYTHIFQELLVCFHIKPNLHPTI